MTLPYTPEKAVYTAERSKKETAPQFPAGAKAKIIRDGKKFYLQLDRAKHPDMVLAYKVKLTYDDKKISLPEFFVSSDYFLHDQKQGRALNINEKIKLPAGSGKMEITPFATFGKAGKTLVTKFNIPKK